MAINKFVIALTLSLAALNFLAEAAAQDPASVPAPELAVGDRWVWNVEDRTTSLMVQRGCSAGYPNGAQEIETVTSLNNVGYVSQIVGPMPEWRFFRTYLNDGSYRARSEGKEILAGPIRFPLRPGNSWDAVLAGGQVLTTLKCRAKTPERMTVGKVELEVMPVICEGKWRHLQSGNSDTAEYNYWYSPAVGRSVRHTGLTYAWGNRCLNVEWRLESYTRKGTALAPTPLIDAAVGTGAQTPTMEDKSRGGDATPPVATQVPQLPKKLKGRWKFNDSSGVTTVDNTWSIEIAEQSADGSIRGTITFWARACTTQDAQMVGRYDGANLVIDVPVLGSCGKGRFALRHNRESKRFEGTYSAETSPAIQGPGSGAYLEID